MKQQAEGSVQEGQTLFAAANSGEGFVSLYDQVFDRKEIRRRYVIKGGPGTGKSSFMRAVAAHARGLGLPVEVYRCSSDPDSVDGIVLDGRIALMDGTAPHCVEPSVAGARDEIVNLGEFWDGERLAERYNDVVAYQALKEACYRRAYRFLSAATSVGDNNRERVAPFLRLKKMEAAVERQLRPIPDGVGFRILPAFVSAVSMKGRVRLDTLEQQAERLVVLEDSYRSASVFLSLLLEEARKKECSLLVSYDPVYPSLPEAVMLEESGVCFVIGEHGDREPDTRINMRRFLDWEGIRRIRTEYRINERMEEALLDSATEALAEAGRYHFELERIYVDCMDFAAQQRFVDSFCQKIR